MANAFSIAGTSRKNSLILNHLTSLPSVETRRIGHGGTLRSQSVAAQSLRQPQDGASTARLKLASIAAHLTDVLQEAEDARLTGGTRSLTRRLLGLNVGAKQRKVPSMVAGAVTQAKVA
jgi:hypothetical protein